MAKRKQMILWMLGCFGLLTLPCGFFGFWLAASASSDHGSPALAAQWRDHLSQFSDPDAARAADSKILVLQFDNGEWVFGRSQDSHGVWNRGGGTVVVRESTGRTRAFFGHVCGGGQLGIGKPKLSSLAEFYRQMSDAGFVEHPLQQSP